MKSSRLVAALFVLVAISAAPSSAGVYADDLGRCLVESATKADRTILVKWFFAAASQHPEVGEFASVTAEQLAASNKGVADLFVRLLVDACTEQSKKAIQYEGRQAISSGFELLGQIAGRELFSSPEVTTAIGGMAAHLDQKKLESIGAGEKPQ